MNTFLIYKKCHSVADEKHNDLQKGSYSRREHYLQACILTITTSVIVMESFIYRCEAKLNECL